MIDLHAHTTASDGSFSPRELVALAKSQGLSALGVTDHDTFGGWDEAFAAGEEFGVEIVPGIELSTVDPGKGKYHVLGYYVARDSELGEELAAIQHERANRNVVILQNLNRLGFSLSMDDVTKYAGEGGVVGRPHFAQAMIGQQNVTTTKDAFDHWIGDDGPAYAGKAVLTPREAIRLIHDAGGIAVWAHPTRSKNVSSEHLEGRLAELHAAGLDGLETFYAAYTPVETDWCERMARKYGLLESGGSDFHGASKPQIQLGVVRDGQGVPDSVLQALQSRAQRALP